jgi:hypothetical protein
MARTTGPAMSLAASGSLGGALVFSNWKGRPYVRSLVTPSNPRSILQVGIRAMMQFLSQHWDIVSAPNRATWQEPADAKNVSTFNAYVSYNMARWRDGFPPTNEWPAARVLTPLNLASLNTTVQERSVTLDIAWTGDADQMGVILFRSPTGTYTPGWNNTRHVIPAYDLSNLQWVDSPLQPGTYYYDAATITLDGVMGTPVGEVPAVVV